MLGHWFHVLGVLIYKIKFLFLLLFVLRYLEVNFQLISKWIKPKPNNMFRIILDLSLFNDFLVGRFSWFNELLRARIHFWW